MIDTSDLREYYLCDVAKELDRLYEVEKEYEGLKQDIERSAERYHPLDVPEDYFWVELDKWFNTCTIANNLTDAEEAAKKDAIDNDETTQIAAVVSKFEPVDQPYTRTDY